MQCKNRVLARESAWPLSQLGKWGCQAGQKQVQKWNLFSIVSYWLLWKGFGWGHVLCPHAAAPTLFGLLMGTGRRQPEGTP